MQLPKRVGAIVAILAIQASSLSAFVWNFTYATATTDGFNDPTNGATYKAALESAANTVASWFSPTYTSTVAMQVTWTNQPASQTLASAGSHYASVVGSFSQGYVQQQVLTGSAATQDGFHGTVNVNFGQTWDFTDSVGGSAYDFKSTMMHELIHALGWVSYIDPVLNSGSAPITTASDFRITGGQSAAAGQQDTWTNFDPFVTDKNGNRIVPGTGIADQSLKNTLMGNTGPAVGDGLYFSGANAMAAAGGRVRLYTPETWSEGSSGSHLDDLYAAYSGMMMLSATGTGPGARTLSAIEVGVMKDLGYTMVPEPSTYWLAGALGAVGLALRRRLKAGN